jgi:hypothetical protein
MDCNKNNLDINKIVRSEPIGDKSGAARGLARGVTRLHQRLELSVNWLLAFDVETAETKFNKRQAPHLNEVLADSPRRLLIVLAVHSVERPHSGVQVLVHVAVEHPRAHGVGNLGRENA